MTLLDIVYVEDLGEGWGNVYDKPYIYGAQMARHIIGTWRIRNRWTIGKTPMASFDVELSGGVKGYGRRRTDQEGSLDVFAYA
jgi:hypothetical protein